MTRDPQKIEILIYEEIERYLKNLETGNGPPPFDSKPSILLMLSHPPDENLIAKTGLKTIIKRFPCAFSRLEPFSAPLPSPFSSLPEILPKERDSSLSENLKNLKLVILFHPSLSIMAQMVLGLTPDFSSCVLLQALLTGIPVFAIQEHPISQIVQTPLWTQKTPLSPQSETCLLRLHSSLKSLIRQYSKTLEEWGMVWIEPDRLFSSIQKLLEGMEQSPRESPSKTKTEAERLVITQEDVIDRVKKGDKQWLIPENAIVTDLAREIAAKQGLILILK